MSEDKTIGYRDGAKPEEIPFKFHIVYTNAVNEQPLTVHEEFDTEYKMNERIIQLASGKATMKKYSSVFNREVDYYIHAVVNYTFYGQYKEIEIKTEHFVIYKK